MAFKKVRTLISRLRTWRLGAKQRQQKAAASLQRQRSAALIVQAREPSPDLKTFIIETVIQDYRNNGRLRQIILSEGRESAEA